METAPDRSLAVEALDTAGVAVYWVEALPNGNFRYSDRGGSNVGPRLRRLAEGKRPEELVAADAARTLTNHYRVCIERADPQRYETPIEVRGQIRWVRTTLIPVREFDRVGWILGVAEDVTAEHRLQDAQRMELVSQITAGLSHDFNNALAIVIGCADLLVAKLREAPAEAAVASDILEAARSASALTGQLQAIGHPGRVATELVRPNDVVQRIARVIGPIAGPSIDVTCKVDPTAGRLRSEPGELERLLLNLALNARDSMPMGGILELRTLAFTVSETGGALKAGSYIRIEVSDTGVGMSPEERERVFEPYYTNKRGGSGRGLGLASVRRIVDRQGGRIHCDSEIGIGTIFRVDLPTESG